MTSLQSKDVVYVERIAIVIRRKQSVFVTKVTETLIRNVCQERNRFVISRYKIYTFI